MAQGDVEVTILNSPVTAAQIDAAITGMRVTANDKWLMCSLEKNIVIARIEEA